MAIQPIDLQTLFTQMDKVGKLQSAQREGFAMQQAIHGIQLQRKAEEEIKAVNQTQNTGEDGAEKIKDRESQAQYSGEGEKKEDQQQPAAEEETEDSLFHDPRLGRNIDISL